MKACRGTSWRLPTGDCARRPALLWRSRPLRRKQAPRRLQPGYGPSASRRAAMQNSVSADVTCDARTVMLTGIDAARSATEPSSLRKHFTQECCHVMSHVQEARAWMAIAACMPAPSLTGADTQAAGQAWCSAHSSVDTTRR